MKERSQIFLKKYKEIFVKKDEKDVTHSLENYVRNRIYECKGNITIQALAKETGYSECYIRRTFHSVHGISPKVFEKFVRFQYVLNQMNQKSEIVTMDEIALECGYYDQSHMIKDFKCFSGMTVIQVLGCGIEKGTREYEVEEGYEMELLPKQQINIVVETERVDEIVELIKQELYTGHIGDGKIFTYRLDNVIRVRTGDEGIDAS